MAYDDDPTGEWPTPISLNANADYGEPEPLDAPPDPFGWWFDYISWVLILSALLLIAMYAPAAPAPKPAGPVPETIPGDLEFQLSTCPVLRCGNPAAPESRVTYWLVFTTRDMEQKVRDIPSGTALRVIGHVGQGGEYRYVIVTQVIRE